VPLKELSPGVKPAVGGRVQVMLLRRDTWLINHGSWNLFLTKTLSATLLGTHTPELSIPRDDGMQVLGLCTAQVPAHPLNQCLQQ
jgi:hypothetical protein